MFSFFPLFSAKYIFLFQVFTVGKRKKGKKERLNKFLKSLFKSNIRIYGKCSFFPFFLFSLKAIQCQNAETQQRAI